VSCPRRWTLHGIDGEPSMVHGPDIDSEGVEVVEAAIFDKAMMELEIIGNFLAAGSFTDERVQVLKRRIDAALNNVHRPRRQIDVPLRRQPIRPTTEQVAAATKAVRHELNEVEALTDFSERGAAEICESVARAALAVLPEGSVDARRWAQAQLDIDTAHRERDSAWLAVETSCTDDYLISRLHQEMAKAKHHHEQEGILAERCEAAADRAEKAEKEREDAERLLTVREQSAYKDAEELLRKWLADGPEAGPLERLENDTRDWLGTGFSGDTPTTKD